MPVPLAALAAPPRSSHASRWQVRPLIAAGLLTCTVPWLLSRMRRELVRQGRFTRTTAGLMWLGYGTWFAALGAVLKRRPSRAGLPMSVAAAVISAGGLALTGAAQRRFAGAGELTGIRQQEPLFDGIYRYSRHPQYTGLIMVFSGLALLRRSLPGGLLVFALAVVFRAWVPVEEEHLERQFGDRYGQYRASTHRWFGLPPASGLPLAEPMLVL